MRDIELFRRAGSAGNLRPLVAGGFADAVKYAMLALIAAWSQWALCRRNLQQGAPKRRCCFSSCALNRAASFPKFVDLAAINLRVIPGPHLWWV